MYAFYINHPRVHRHGDGAPLHRHRSVSLVASCAPLAWVASQHGSGASAYDPEDQPRAQPMWMSTTMSRGGLPASTDPTATIEEGAPATGAHKMEE
jgi:hypothetical protein